MLNIATGDVSDAAGWPREGRLPWVRDGNRKAETAYGFGSRPPHRAGARERQNSGMKKSSHCLDSRSPSRAPPHPRPQRSLFAVCSPDPPKKKTDAKD
jgi:hypothetical protein